MSVNLDLPLNQGFVNYLDLGGGLNTKNDPHAIDRNELAISQNTWYKTANALGKRPGNSPAITVSGASGSTHTGQAMAYGSFTNLTTLLLQTNNTILSARATDVTWSSSIGSVTAGGLITATQYFDQNTSTSADGTVFVCTGKDAPRTWLGPGTTLQAIGGGVLPVARTGGLAITPAYCETLLTHLFYAGEPTDPSAVYISDSNLPSSFTQNATLQNATAIGTGSSYIPEYAGRSDGRGKITGLKPMGNAMIIYKQGGIWRFDYIGLNGDWNWAASVVSATNGATSPRSIVDMGSWHCFLSMDGVYATDGTPGGRTYRISENVYQFFEGPQATILDRTTAVGVRYGMRYLLFYDDGNGTGVPVGYPTRGMWFDFNKLDKDSLPTTGEIIGMNVNGVVPLRGPLDTGNFAWCSGAADLVGAFAKNPHSGDFGNPVKMVFGGKNDFMVDVFPPVGPGMGDAPVSKKAVDHMRILYTLPNVLQGNLLNFQVSVTFDNTVTLQSAIQSNPIIGGPLSLVGTAVVGTATVSAVSSGSQYQEATAWMQSPALGRVLQGQITESSVYEWTSLGYMLFVSKQGTQEANPVW